MPTVSPKASTKSRHRDKSLNRIKETAQSKQSLRTSQKQAPQSPKPSHDEMARLKEIINKLQSEPQIIQSEVMDDFSGSSDLRWKVNKLEKDKLELSTKYNEEVARYEGEIAKLRAALERGEAQRQNLEYEMALVRRDAMMEKNATEVKAAAVHSRSEKLKVRAAELQQRVLDLEKALSLTRHARDEDQQALHLELEERDRLLMTTNAECDHLTTEKKRLEALLQSEEDTLKELRRRMDQMQEERERDTESLRRQAGELRLVSEREHRFKMELEAAQLRVKALEENVESERAAHLESKLNSEIIQLRARDLEAVLQLEKSAQVEALSSLELMKHRFGDVEKAYEQERDKARDSLQQLAKFEKDYLARKSELTEELKEKRRAVVELTGALQAFERQQGQSQINLEKVRMQHACLEESLEGFRRDLEQTLRHCAVSDPRSSEEPGENSKLSLHTLLDTLRKTLTSYQDTLERRTRELHDLRKMYESAIQEHKLYEEMNSTLKKNIEEAHLGLARANDEVMRLRGDCSNNAELSNRAQAELSAIRNRWKLERERASEAEIEIQRLTQLYQKDSQISHLEFVCQNRSEAVRELQQTQESTFSKLAEQMRQREEDLLKQRRDLEEHYSSLTSEVQARAKKWQSAAEQAQEKADSLERTGSEAAVDLARLQNLLPQARRERATLLSACALLAGALCPLYRQLCSLADQKALLQRRLESSQALEKEVGSLVRALTAGDEGAERPEPGPAGAVAGARSFRKCAIVVMAAGRFRRLGQRSQILFSLERDSADLPALSVCAGGSRASDPASGQERGARRSDMALRWFQSKALLDLVLSTVGELQEQVTKEGPGSPASRSGFLAGARSCFAKLMERLLLAMDGSSRLPCLEKGALSGRLGQGLQKLNRRASQSDAAAALTSKGAVAALQRLVLEFTQRLHSAEVERRSLRVELAEQKRSAAEAMEQDRQDRRTTGVPVERFESLCAELGSALEREQQAQALLQEQALQLKELGLRLELHSGEEAEKDQTLSDAVKSLSEAKTELKRKDQSLRQLVRQLSQLQQDKRQVEESIRQAESALRLAAKSKDALTGYMRSVESALDDVKERILLSRAAVTREDFTLQLPRVHLDTPGSERLMGGPEMTACQSFISTFMDVYQMACSRMALLEKEMTSHQAHISHLKNELQDACLRENQCFVPIRTPPRPQVPEPPMSPQSPHPPERAVEMVSLQPEAELPRRASPRNAWSQRSGSSLSGSHKTSREPRDSTRSPYSSGGYWTSK
ncbi:coiled-coil domain-containing protein 171-like isoform X4 [Conger conger]|uniref:coiled-coil domain-containing protein 171-like isoform X4 n=1 Tax=Conger conger TaxID=82655 RepID=UPI002A5AFA4C|nr:coiled-coil domain-containing protein 171-like isoform X4 [Conger conger]